MADYDQNRLADYVDVPARIAEFRSKYPDGSLQPADLAHPYRIEQIGDQHYVVVVAAAYRSPEDPRPGVGMAYEQWPGRTPYTKNSELQNAETSAWGRAIVAALAADTKRIASAEDVRNRRADDEWDTAAARPPSEAQTAKYDELSKSLAGAEPTPAGMRGVWDSIVAAFKADEITTTQANALRSALSAKKELEARGDSTSDGDGSSAEPREAGAGPGPDGQGTTERGPGLGGEAGGGGSGVQPRVHGGNRVDRGTQARSGDRDAPAAAGQRSG